MTPSLENVTLSTVKINFKFYDAFIDTSLDKNGFTINQAS